MKIENNRYEITFCEKGGEMLSFLDKQNNIQYLYQGDSEFWSGKNPGLFPIIGNTYSKSYEIDGKTYAMKNHGLVRYSTLNCIHHEQDRITFELCDNEETRKQYPFSFRYQVQYVLLDNKVSITYDIQNTGDRDMPFTFGLHPAFLCPLSKEETFEDYHIIFSNQEQVKQIVFDPEMKKSPIYKDVCVQEIPLTYDWIMEYATIVYEHCKSAYVTLKGKEHGVKVSIAGYPYLAFWTPKEGAPFLCIEPWYGHGDYEAVDVDFYHREGTMILSSNKTFTTSYDIEVF